MTEENSLLNCRGEDTDGGGIVYGNYLYENIKVVKVDNGEGGYKDKYEDDSSHLITSHGGFHSYIIKPESLEVEINGEWMFVNKEKENVRKS